MVRYWLLGLAAAVLALGLTPLVARVAEWLGVVDEPGERRVHDVRTPSLGGVAVLFAFLGALAAGTCADPDVAAVFIDPQWQWVLAGALAVVACGVADDAWSLGPWAKICFQSVAGAMVLVAGLGVSAVTNPFSGSSIPLGNLGPLLTLLWVVGITNAFNLIDGLDGLAAGVALIATGTLFVVSLAGGRTDVAIVAAALAGALAGFLYHNFNPASVFLGDSGSLLLGYLLSVLSIQAAQKGATAVVLLVPILALGLPIMDTLLTMLRRVLGALHVVQLDSERNEYRFLVVGSASVFRADRNHIHHRLLAMGLTHRRAVLLLYGVCAALGALAFLAVRARGSDTALLVGIVAVASYVGVRKLGYREVEVLRRGTLLPLFALPVFSRRVFHALVDAGFVAAAHCASLLLTGRGGLDVDGEGYALFTLPVVVAAKLAVLVWAGTYRRVYRSMGASDFFALAKSLVVAQAVAIAATAVTYGLQPGAAVSWTLDFYFSATLVIGARASFRILELLAQGSGHEKALPVLIYGAGSGGLALLREIRQNPGLRCRVVGFIDDSPSLQGQRIQGVPVLGTAADLANAIGQWGVREILVSSPTIPQQRLAYLAAVCRAHGVELRRFRMALEQIETVGQRAEAALGRAGARRAEVERAFR